MPPEPIAATISYGPSRVPEDKDMTEPAPAFYASHPMKRLVLLFALFFVLACRQEVPQKPATETAAAPQAVVRDPHSYSRPDEVRVEHITLDLATDFAKKQLVGTATLRIKREAGAKTLVLDTNGLDVRKVTL